MPWLQVALGASLAAVLAVNLPEREKHAQGSGGANAVAVAEPMPAGAAETLSKPASAKPVIADVPDARPVTVATVPAPGVDADLLENLEMYEDAEFYQWLSEQDAEGAIDA